MFFALIWPKLLLCRTAEVRAGVEDFLGFVSELPVGEIDVVVKLYKEILDFLVVSIE